MDLRSDLRGSGADRRAGCGGVEEHPVCATFQAMAVRDPGSGRDGGAFGRYLVRRAEVGGAAQDQAAPVVAQAVGEALELRRVRCRSGTPDDTLASISPQNLEDAGRALSLALMILGRETDY